MKTSIRSMFSISLLLMLCIALTQNNAIAQTPHYEGMSYQAVARDASGDPLLNQTISLRLQVIRQLAIAYEEARSITTNDHGLFSVVIGDGVGTASGIWSNFEDIDWSGNYTYRLAVLADLSGGTSYVPLANEIIHAVPFAQRAREADGLTGGAWEVDAIAQRVWSGTGYDVGIGTATPKAILDVSEDILVNGITIGRGGDNRPLNLAIGDSALLNNGSTFSYQATDNTAVGYGALQENTYGINNTALGYRALQANVSGGGNTAIGRYSMGEATGGGNTAVGVSSLSRSENGGNAAVGMFALTFNTTGSNNIAMGNSSLFGNTTGGRNCGLGSQTNQYNQTGSDNVAIGYRALYENLTDFNIGVGNQAMYFTTTGGSNVAMGHRTLYRNETSTGNVAIGHTALENSTGFSNTAVGADAGDDNVAGYRNTYIGFNAGPTSTAQYNYSMSLGEYSIVSATDQIRLGTSFTQSIGGYQAWTNLSDGRMKKNVVEDVSGLDLILKLRPVTYELDHNAIIKADYGNDPEAAAEMRKQISERANSSRETGFIAQEVEAAAKELGIEFSGVDAPKNENDKYGLRYATFVVPLVKAVQEQQAMIEKQNATIEELRSMVIELQQR